MARKEILPEPNLCPSLLLIFPASTKTARKRPSPDAYPPALLTVDDVAEHIGASTRHVRRLIERGQLPIIRIGKLVRVAPDDLARLIAARRES